MSSTLFISPYIPHHSREFLPIPRVPCAKLTFKGNDLVDAIKRAKAGLSWDLQWGRDKTSIRIMQLGNIQGVGRYSFHSGRGNRTTRDTV